MKKRYIQPEVFKQFNNLKAAETTRYGGVSSGFFTSLNMGNFTEDNVENIIENRRLVLDDLGFSSNDLAYSKQIHDDKVHIVNEPNEYIGFDALITQQKGIMLGVTVADCTPILIYDVKNQVVAAIHAGWKGTVLQIVHKTLNIMQTNFGTQGNNCFAYIGTCIDICDFEVGSEVASQFSDSYKVFYESKNKYHVDLKEANKEQLLNFGIPLAQIEISKFSTFQNTDNYFSFRAENGITGRMMALIGMQ